MRIRRQSSRRVPSRLPPSTGAGTTAIITRNLLALLVLVARKGTYTSALRDGCQYFIYDDTDKEGIQDGPLGPGKTAYGPKYWDKVERDCFREMNFDWAAIDDKNASISIDYDENQCKSTSVSNLFKARQETTDTISSDDFEEGQSPKLLQADGRCTDRHRMYQKNRLCTYGDIDYAITPYSVRAGLQSCKERPQIDYSRSTKLQNLHYFEFKVPGEHVMRKNGTDYNFVAELNMAHVGTESDNHELSDVNIVYIAGNEDECDDEVEDHLIFFERAMEDMYAGCKYPVNAWRADDLCRVRRIINDLDPDDPSPAPTDPPTGQPTPTPTQTPSESSKEPTSSVSVDEPTTSPTSSPSTIPSSSPSAVPSSSPSTSSPTQSPSGPPSSSTSSPTIDDDNTRTAITPMMNGNFIGNGEMFDVLAHMDLIITSIDIHLYTPVAKIEVYTKSGSSEDYQNDADSWTLLGSATVQSSGYGMLTPLPKSIFNPPIDIAEGERRAFYVTTVNENDRIRYSHSAAGKLTGDLYGGNDHLSFGVGYANRYPFQFAWRNRLFNGAVNYILTGQNAPQLWPSSAPTTSDDMGGEEEEVRHVTSWLNGTYIGHGTMFDVLAHVDMKIVSLDIHQYTPTAIVTVFSKVGSSQGYQRNATAWTLLGTVPQLVNGMGYGQVTPLLHGLFEPISMVRGETRAFYVTVMHDEQRMRYSKSPIATGEVYAGNSDLSFIVGYANRYPFGYAWADRQANVGVGYMLEGTVTNPPTASNVPSMTPTLSSVPSSTPSMDPTHEPTVDKEVIATMDGGYINSGNMFDIRAKNDLRILALEINLYTATADVAVFTKVGSCQGYETNSSAWTHIGTAYGVQSQGYKERTALPYNLFDPLVVLQGDVQGFYVTVVNGNEGRISYSAGTVGVGEPYGGNVDMDILTGYANTAYPPQFAWADRRSNAWVVYTVDGTPTTTILDQPAQNSTRRLAAAVDEEKDHGSICDDVVGEGTCRKCCGGTPTNNRNLQGGDHKDHQHGAAATSSLLRGRKEGRRSVEDSCTAVDCDKCCGKVGDNTQVQVDNQQQKQKQKFAQLEALVSSSANIQHHQRRRRLAISTEDRVSPYKMYTKTGTPYMYKYEGSQTHPPCYQTTEHRVLYEPRKLCPRQLDVLERMIAGYLDGRCKMATVGRMRNDGTCKVDVNRPLQVHDHGDSSVAMKECLAWQ